jgi:hypothetical protein
VSGLAALCVSAVFAVGQTGLNSPAVPAPSSALVELEARMPKQWDQSVVEKFSAEVVSLAGSNTLSTADEFYRLAQISIWGSHEYRVARVS